MLQKIHQQQISVDGIDIQGFIDGDVTVHEGFSVEKSELGGFGIFLTVDQILKDKIDETQDLLIARIPAKITFDLPLLLSKQETLKLRSPKEWEIIKQVLSNCEGVNETEILIDYFFAFMIIINNHQESGIKDLEFYLEILSQTNVDVLENSDDFLSQVELKKKHQLEAKYTEIIQSLSPSKVHVPSFEEYYHMNKVIRSRVLEIPHSVEENDEDYTVNTTLVPLLDFANHRYDNNAYFDVDKGTGDILLKVKSDTISMGKQEICIQYSDTKSVQHFVSTYGFIPHNSVQVFEIKVNSNDINHCINKIQDTVDVKYDLIMKWLEISPIIQLIKNGDEIGANVNFNPIPFWVIFSHKFEYVGWEDKLNLSLINDDDLHIDNVEDLRTFIKFQEDKCDVIQGLEKVAIIPDTIEDFDEDECKQKFFSLIKMLNDHKSLPDTSLTSQYLNYKRNLLEKVSSEIDIEHDGFYRPATIYG
ncbi:hypothetical protein CLIB1444_25S00342 [[Candida] jaroonii]|uniref:Uncharacterized protein n=1 Tax=[Candida] jaroonii TaxID=467808 RepID=A0ACA9YGM0_9ASCO|nr:hypothetical protein CLIB1444_25S00342 [[Candida] jaroonii]